MDEHNVNEQIQAGLALFANKQRELEALAAHIEQEKLQLVAQQQQTPMSFPMVNPYLAMGAQQQLPFAQPAPALQQQPMEQVALAEPNPQPAPQPPQATPSTSMESLVSDVRMLARGLDEHATKFNAALENVMTTMNDISRRLVLLEGGQTSSPTFDEVIEATPQMPAKPEPEPVVDEPSVAVDDDLELAQRVDLLSLNVQQLTKIVDMVLDQQLKTNEYQRELLDFLSAQFGHSPNAESKTEPAGALETPYVASTTAAVVDDRSDDAVAKKSKKHKRKKKKR